MQTFHSKTCNRLVPRKKDYVGVENKAGCFSSLGRVGGSQVISLNRQGCLCCSIVQHEVTPALGSQHEQTRSARSNYCMYFRIKWKNFDPQMAYDSYKQSTNIQNIPYGYSSIMHYRRTVFFINGKDSITPSPNPNTQIGQRQGCRIRPYAQLSEEGEKKNPHCSSYSNISLGVSFAAKQSFGPLLQAVLTLAEMAINFVKPVKSKAALSLPSTRVLLEAPHFLGEWGRVGKVEWGHTSQAGTRRITARGSVWLYKL
ncbi:hypothetical protein FQN60_011301 [Etheostoma spectabile]|uniref:Peptidase M12A domain-containing protein n=1 Tax=Etheostoma spectabile TaxID=54343 RepID=A0A5J5DRQ5_9PERO|nr:hypothetical protein FQN60_011301 [Etheostoma spectabile]